MVVAATVATVASLAGGVPPATAASPDQPVVRVGDGGGGDVDSFNSRIPGPFAGDPHIALTAPTLLDDGSRTYLWFCAVTGSGPSSIGLKISTDHGLTWPSSGTSYSLFPTAGGLDTTGVCDPSVVRYGDYFYMAYQAADGAQTQLFVARASVAAVTADGLHGWLWQKWTGSGWAWNASPAPLATGTNDSTAPSLVIVGGVISVFYTEAISGGEDNLRLMQAPIGDSWPAQISGAHTVLQSLDHLKSPLDVKWDDATKQFVALGTDAHGHVVAYRSGPAGAPFTWEPADDIDDASNQAGALALAGDASGHLLPYTTYTVPAAAGTVRLHRSAIQQTIRSAGDLTDGFHSMNNWVIPSGTTSTWRVNPLGTGVTFAPDTGSDGTAVGTAWEGDGWYELTMHGFGPYELTDVGLQIGRQRIHGAFTDSGYTVTLGNLLDGTYGRLQLFTGGEGRVAAGAYIPGWPYPSKTTELTINILKDGARLTIWPSWPGDPNKTHQYGLTTSLPGFVWGAGHPALVVDQGEDPGYISTTFESFAFTPIGELSRGPDGRVILP
jgi:hypothetical protein